MKHTKKHCRKAMRVVWGSVLVGSLVVSLAGCASASGVSDTSQGTAATVDGAPIGEKTISDYIANFRSASSLDTDEAWAQWLVSSSYTPADVREEVVKYYIDDQLYRKAAKENNVEVSQSDIDDEIASEKQRYDGDDAWQKALEASNLTEQRYRDEVIEPGLLQRKLKEAVVPSSEMSDDEVLAAAQSEAALLNGARRSSHILFSSEDEQKAQEVLDRIRSGELDFAEAAKEYSIDGSAQGGGDVGWDVLTNFVTEYQDALYDLDQDQVSDLVTSQFGIHIIKCTEVFTVPENGIESLDTLPAELRDAVQSSQATNDGAQAFSDWFEEYKAKADIQINDMPSGLSYDIDLTPYQSSAAGSTAPDDATASIEPNEGDGSSAESETNSTN